MHESEQGLVQFHFDDAAMVRPFLGVAAALVRLLGPNPAPGEVSAAMRRLVTIFQDRDSPRGTVIGIWGELFVIANSVDPGAMVDAWHSAEDQLFDFAAPGSRLEVKTTTRPNRVHVFNLRQLMTRAGQNGRVVSVMTTETDNGTSVSDLVEMIESRLSSDFDRQMKLHEQAAAILGGDWASYCNRRFDLQEAKHSLVVLDPIDVPQVPSPASEVLEVTLTVDCSSVPEAAVRIGLSALL